MKEKNSGIYKIENLKTGKIYIGSSTRIDSRFKTHKKELDENIHINTELQSDWNEIGCEYFTMEKIEEVNDPYNLKERESYYIKLYTGDKGVYNKSDPMYEYIKGRQEEVKINKGDNRGKRTSDYKLSKDYILKYLLDNFKDVLKTLLEKVETDKYFDKGKFDRWLLKNIKDEDVKNDERVEGLINKMYNKLGLCILNSRLYSFQLYGLGIKVDEKLEYILVKKSLSAELYNIKYVKVDNKKRFVK